MRSVVWNNIQIVKKQDPFSYAEFWDYHLSKANPKKTHKRKRREYAQNKRDKLKENPEEYAKWREKHKEQQLKSRANESVETKEKRRKYQREWWAKNKKRKHKKCSTA